MYPIFEVEGRRCQNAWKSGFGVAKAMDVGDVLGCGGVGGAVGTVFSVDDVTRMVCWEVEVKVDVEDRVIGRGLGVESVDI
jgi:hypothetical protein